MKNLLTILLFIIVVQSHGQTIIQGTIKDQKGTTIPGVNVFIKNTYEGITSDLEGTFLLKSDEVGHKILVFQSLGFKTQEKPVELKGGILEVSPILREAINELTAVTISAGAMEASDEKKAVVLRPIDIVTVPSAMGDIIGAFQTLPGTSTVGNDGRLFVRGGDASETAIFIDGLKAGNAFGSTTSNVPTRTRFSPNLFKGSFFSTGGYSAEYGQALSSALALNTMDIPLRNQGDVSLMSLGGGFTQTLAGERSSLTASANYFDLAPYQSSVKQNFDWERSPYGWNAEVSVRQKWGNGGMVKAYAHTESGGMKIWQPLVGSDDRGQLISLKNRYSFGQTSFKQVGARDWNFYGGISFSNNVDDLMSDGTAFRNKNQVLHSKFVTEKSFSDKFTVKTGAEYFFLDYEELIEGVDLSRGFHDHQANLFTESDYYFNSKLVIRSGLRFGSSSLADSKWLDPRASIAYKFSNEGQLSFAAGRFSQFPIETLRVLSPQIQNMEAGHLILNYFIVKNGRTFRAEAFHKDYKNLLTFRGQSYQYSNIKQNGAGFAKGFDVFFRDRESFRNTDFWITYSFVDSKRKFAEFTQQVQPGFAPKHNGSLVIKHFVTKLKSQIGFSVLVNDGYTYTDPNQGGQMNSKTKSFQEISVSWSYLPKPNLIVHLACSNVMGRDNVFGYQFNSQPDNTGKFESIAIRQGAPRFIFLGVFLTLSKDKTANQLNNL